MTNTDANHPVDVFDGVPFDDFYDRALPVVYGYLLRLCGGDREEAWDLTQDCWMVLLDRLAKGQTEKATIGYLISQVPGQQNRQVILDVDGTRLVINAWAEPGSPDVLDQLDQILATIQIK